MSAASSIRITKIRISKDKVGQKYAAIEVTRVLDEDDRYTDSVSRAVEQMKENLAIDTMKLSDTLSANLSFWAAAGLDKPNELLPGVEVKNFKLDREETGAGRSYLVLTYEFEIKLEEARRWLIPCFGDDVLCVMENAQLSFPK